MRKPGTYIRFKISPSTIHSVAKLGGQIIETGLGVNHVVSSFRLKHEVEKHAKLAGRLQTGKSVAEIALKGAQALTNLLSRNG